ncbi:MAG: hypothetical protein HONDAALG_00081 [Gammaproteobacteria bacterium]|nr:hypothetical protein [Gammaproteobacteria bacterium]
MRGGVDRQVAGAEELQLRLYLPGLQGEGGQEHAIGALGGLGLAHQRPLNRRLHLGGALLTAFDVEQLLYRGSEIVREVVVHGPIDDRSSQFLPALGEGAIDPLAPAVVRRHHPGAGVAVGARPLGHLPRLLLGLERELHHRGPRDVAAAVLVQRNHRQWRIPGPKYCVDGPLFQWSDHQLGTPAHGAFEGLRRVPRRRVVKIDDRLLAAGVGQPGGNHAVAHGVACAGGLAFERKQQGDAVRRRGERGDLRCCQLRVQREHQRLAGMVREFLSPLPERDGGGARAGCVRPGEQREFHPAAGGAGCVPGRALQDLGRQGPEDLPDGLAIRVDLGRIPKQRLDADALLHGLEWTIEFHQRRRLQFTNVARTVAGGIQGAGGIECLHGELGLPLQHGEPCGEDHRPGLDVGAGLVPFEVGQDLARRLGLPAIQVGLRGVQPVDPG